MRRSQACSCGGEPHEEDCDLTRLDSVVASSSWLPLVNRAYDLKHALENGFTVTLDDVSVAEFAALQALTTEYKRYEQQQNSHVKTPDSNQ